MIWIIFIGIAVVSYIVQANLKNKFNRYSQEPLQGNLTGRDVAVKMLHDNGIYDVQVTSTPGQLTDHYNPANKTVNLSEGVYNSCSVAAAAVAAAGTAAAAAAAAVANAEVEKTTDANGLDAVKVTFDNGILFNVGKSTLQAVRRPCAGPIRRRRL